MEHPKTLKELAEYIDQNKDDIYVRHELNGKWGSYALTELPAADAISHALRLLLRYKQEPDEA